MAYDSRQRIYSSTALANRQREVKDAAEKGLVFITENGNGAFVFCSEEVYAAEIERAREEARYEAQALYALRRAKADVKAGRTMDFADFKKAMTERVSSNG